MLRKMTARDDMEADGFEVQGVHVTRYTTILIEQHRPPSRGGNTRAWHSHALWIDGEKYTFRALGSKKWVYVGDRVSFRWRWDPSQRWRNIDIDSVKVADKNGTEVIRGERGFKRWRTAPTRLPASRREQRD